MINKCQYGIICFISSGSHIIHIENNKVLINLNSEWLKSLLHKDKKICRNSELNQGHRDFQSLALPTELLRHIYLIFTGLVEQALRFPYTFRLSAPLGELLRHILLNFHWAGHPPFYSLLKSRKSIVLAKYN